MATTSKTISLKRGDIVLVPFPFTDLSSTKVRPAVLISADKQRNDVIIAFISSITENLHTHDVVLKNTDTDFLRTGLKKSSVFKMDKLLTISSVLVLRRLGHVSPDLQYRLDNALKTALGLS